jgi:hypothetical protein
MRFWKRLAFELVDRAEIKLTLFNVESPNRTKRQRSVNWLSVLKLGHPSSPALRHQSS